MSQKLKYKRVLLKLSGEALLGNQQFGIDPTTPHKIYESIAELVALGVEVGIVVGGGNFVRGALLSKGGLDRVTCDQMGMMATIMNGLVLRDSLLAAGIGASVMSSIAVQGIVDAYDRAKAIMHLQSGRVMIFVAGTGAPFFTTDSAASLRAIEVRADVLLKATKVDGVYSADPKIHPDAKRFTHLSYDEVLERQLGVMDLTAVCLCRDQQMPIRVFDMHQPHVLRRIVLGEPVGTIVSKES